MRALQLTFLTVFFIVTCCGFTQDIDHAAATKLFDGRSLNDWEFEAEHWRIENGAMVGEVPAGEHLNHNTWMIWRGGELRTSNYDYR